jgi:hypothetical protein
MWSSLTRAHAVLDRYDRPLHRRRHASEMDRARRDIARLPQVIADERACQRTSGLPGGRSGDLPVHGHEISRWADTSSPVERSFEGHHPFAGEGFGESE